MDEIKCKSNNKLKTKKKKTHAYEKYKELKFNKMKLQQTHEV